MKNRDIECLRAVAIIITLVAHIGSLIGPWNVWTTFFWLGGGVDLFFAISGFLITGQLLAGYNSGQRFWPFATGFWIKRAFRLWPAATLWSTLTLLFVFAVPQIHEPMLSGRELFPSWLTGLFNVQNLYLVACSKQFVFANCNGSMLWHYWSLSLEEQFYFIWPFVIFLPWFKKPWISIPLLLVVAILQSTAIRPWGGLLWFTRSDALLYGCAVAILWHHYPALRERLARNVSVGKAALVLCLVGLIVLSKLSWFSLYMGNVAIMAGACVFLASFNKNFFSDSQLTSIFERVGARSYSIYLIHNPVFAIARELTLRVYPPLHSSLIGQLSLSACVLALVWLLADFSFKWIETPLRDHGRRIAAERAARQGAYATA